MSTQPENKIGFGISRSHVDMGYGKFPYVIIRISSGIYMQIPIHFVKEDEKGLKGILIQTESDNPKEQQSLLLHSIWRFKQHIDAQKKNFHRLFVVLDANQAYYFEPEGLKFSHSIPAGGTLIASQNEFVAMGHPHHVESKNTECHG
jgi:hypothetical protein